MDTITQAVGTAIGYISLIDLADIVDIAIMSYVIYRVLLLIRKSRSGQVAKAIVIIIALQLLATVFGLSATGFVLGQAVQLGLIALIIIFQPELRRLLEQMGSGKLKGVFATEEAPEELENAIVQTVAAYRDLSKDKVGALMVFERKTLLDDVLQSGTRLDASVSAELLKNIFWNKAPMHDGAVVVRGGRIEAAACVLPLSAKGNLSRDLGTRHRAGVGMSENSDAVVAIVSEETGSISVAINGMLKRHLAPETLERLLRRELLPELEEKPAHGDLLSGLNALLKTNGKGKKGDGGNGQEDH